MDVFSGVCLRSSLCRAYRKPLNAVAARRVHSSINSSHVEGSPEPDMRHVQINPEAGTVETPVGSLPISPFMDPLFYEARQRFTKSKPSHSPFKSTKFQRKLARNPYARALATPPRNCPISSVVLPNFFLQRFNLVAHPHTQRPWFVPQDLEPKSPKAIPTATEETRDGGSPDSSATGPVKEQRQGIRTGPSGYTLSSQLLLQEIQRRFSPYFNGHTKLMRMSDHGNAQISTVLNQAAWRDDMDSFLLDVMRRRVVESLLHFAGLSEQPDRNKYLVKCERWDDAKDHKHRGCLLFLPKDEALSGSETELVPPRLSTMTIEGVKYGRKLAVHNLLVLLGEDHMGQLRRGSALLRDGSLFLLGRQATVKLQMLLWKLQGYMAWETPEDAKSTTIDEKPRRQPA